MYVVCSLASSAISACKGRWYNYLSMGYLSTFYSIPESRLSTFTQIEKEFFGTCTVPPAEAYTCNTYPSIGCTCGFMRMLPFHSVGYHVSPKILVANIKGSDNDLIT